MLMDTQNHWHLEALNKFDEREWNALASAIEMDFLFFENTEQEIDPICVSALMYLNFRLHANRINWLGLKQDVVRYRSALEHLLKRFDKKGDKFPEFRVLLSWVEGYYAENDPTGRAHIVANDRQLLLF